MPEALKAIWEVRAGVIPLQPVSELTKRWTYTSSDHAEDERLGKAGGVAYHAIFARKRAEALDYYMQVSLPQISNWAEISFLWY